jgi:hypothetical protein
MLMQTLWDNMHTKKRSNFIVTMGKKGSGKSWLGLAFGETLEGKTFGMAHVCFSAETLFDMLDKKQFKEGDVVILEEIGIAANARDAMTRSNKHLSFLAQAIRPARITLIANTISWGLIDNQIKNMADYCINVIGYDVEKRITKFKFMAISPNPRGTEPFRSHMQFEGAVKYVSWTMKAPSKELGEQYNEARDVYTRQIYADGVSTIRDGEDVRFGKTKPKHIVRPDEELIADGIEHPDKVRKKGKLDARRIELYFKVNANKAQKIKSGIEMWDETHTPV